MRESTADTAPYFVIGDPIGHSLSPTLFQKAAPDLDYRARQVAPSELEAFLRAEHFSGLSVTLPHKESIAAHLDHVDPAAAQIGAINCVSLDGEQTVGWNTDAQGLVRALKRAVALQGKRVQLLGAGGAARAAAFALTGAGASVTIENRTRSRAEGLAKDAGADVGLDPSADIIVQATRVGLDAPDADPLPESYRLHEGQLVLDMVYRPLRTALLQRADRAGAQTIDGLWMLVEQGLQALEIWTGRVTRGQAAPLHAHLATLDVMVSGRAAIDAIDRELIELLRGRFEAARAIGEVKAARGEPVVRPERERELRDKHRRWAAAAGVDEDLARRVFDVVLDSSRRMQEKLKP